MSRSWGIFSETFFSQNFFFRILQPQKPVFTLPKKSQEFYIVPKFEMPNSVQRMLADRAWAEGMQDRIADPVVSLVGTLPVGDERIDQAMPIELGANQIIGTGKLGCLKRLVRAVREIREQDDSDPACGCFLLSGSSFIFTRGWFGASEGRNFNFATAAFLFSCGSLSFVSVRSAQSLLFNGVLLGCSVFACVFVAAIFGGIDLSSRDQLASDTPG